MTHLLLFSNRDCSEEYLVITQDPQSRWDTHRKPDYELDAAFDITEAKDTLNQWSVDTLTPDTPMERTP